MASSASADQKLETAVGMMLRIGVTLSALIVVIGGILYLQHPGSAAPDYTHFHSAPKEALSIHGTMAGVAHVSSVSIIQFGLLLLIATPVLRVLLALIGFLLEKDKIYTFVSLVVLVILLFSLVHSR